MLTYRFRLYPTEQQKGRLNETIETCRRLYNDLLADRIKSHAGAFEQKRALTAHRKQDKFLKLVNSQVTQDVVFRLDKAYQAFFAGLMRFPKFRRFRRYNSFTYPQVGGFRVVGKRLRLSMLGSLKIRLHRPVKGQMKTCTIIRNIDQWFVCITSETTGRKVPINKKPAVGVDVGILSAAALSDGKIIPPPGILKNSSQL